MDLTNLKSLVPLQPREYFARLEDRGTRAFRSRGGEQSLRKSVTGMLLGAPPTTEAELRPLMERRGMKYDEAFLGRVHRYWASDQRVDDQGDIVVQNWDFSRFEKNSPMPWNHNWHALPVGRVLDWAVVQRGEADYQGPALRTLCVFGTRAMNPMCDKINNLVKAGLLPGSSVGFNPVEVLDVADDGERQQLGLGRNGLIWARNQLLELSPTTMPANSGAVTFSIYKGAADAGLLTVDSLHILREVNRAEALRSADPEREMGEAEAALLEIAKTLWPDTEFEVHGDLETEVEPTESRKTMVSMSEDIADLKKALGEIRSAVIETAALAQEIKDAQTTASVAGLRSRTKDDDQAREGGESLLDAPLARAMRNLDALRARGQENHK